MPTPANFDLTHELGVVPPIPPVTVLSAFLASSSGGHGAQMAAAQANFRSWPFPSAAVVGGTKLQRIGVLTRFYTWVQNPE
jgi:hypothetical protein